jgi:hypothetical protein
VSAAASSANPETIAPARTARRRTPPRTPIA